MRWLQVTLAQSDLCSSVTWPALCGTLNLAWWPVASLARSVLGSALARETGRKRPRHWLLD